jgi:hypothetical protein
MLTRLLRECGPNSALPAANQASAAAPRKKAGPEMRNSEPIDSRSGTTLDKNRERHGSVPVASGAKPEGSSNTQILLARAADARSRAVNAKLVATGSAKGMSGARSTAMAARAEVANSELEIKAAIAQILLEQLEPNFQKLERAHVEYVDALTAISALHMLVRATGPMHPFHPFASATAADEITRRLKNCEIHHPNDTDLRPRAGALVDFARRLASDPDANA